MLPKSIKEAITAQYPEINLRSGLLAGLMERGVEHIFISSCGFGPIPNARTLGMTAAEFRIIPQAFMARLFTPRPEGPLISGEVLVGIFEDNGIQSLSDDRSLEDSVVLPGAGKRNTLAPQMLLFNQPQNKFLPDNVLIYRLLNPEGLGSFYVVAITLDKKQILITQVLLMNNRTDAERISDLFITTPDFMSLVRTLSDYVRVCFASSPPDKQALDHAIDSLESLSSNDIVEIPIEWGDGPLPARSTCTNGSVERSSLTDNITGYTYPAIRVNPSSGGKSCVEWVLNDMTPFSNSKWLKLTCLVKLSETAQVNSLYLIFSDGIRTADMNVDRNNVVVPISILIPHHSRGNAIKVSFSNTNSQPGAYVEFANIKIKILELRDGI